MSNRRVSVRGIIWKNGKIFGVKHKERDGSETDFWAIPGGGLDPNEALIDGLHREMIEETAIAPDIGNLLFVQQFSYGENEQMEFFFHIKNADDYEAVDLLATTHGHLELARCDFIDPKKEYLLPEFLQSIDIESYITGPQPVYVATYLTS